MTIFDYLNDYEIREREIMSKILISKYVPTFAYFYKTL